VLRNILPLFQKFVSDDVGSYQALLRRARPLPSQTFRSSLEPLCRPPWTSLDTLIMSHNHTDPSLRITYTPPQLAQYFDTIGLPSKYRSSSVLTSPSKDAANSPEGLLILSKLIKYQICGIPWENLELHYSSHHTITLDPHHLLHKMVERSTGRGGYCMENTAILATVMRSLGYEVMTTGARVNEAVQPVSASKNWTGPRFDGLYVLMLKLMQ
jgi:N-acetyltransferase